MKWPKNQVDIYTAAVVEWLASHNCPAERLRKDYAVMPEMHLMYLIDRQVTYDLQYTDNHPAYRDITQDGVTYKARTRRCKHNPFFVLYPPGCDDSHRKTMLRSVGKTLGLITTIKKVR